MNPKAAEPGPAGKRTHQCRGPMAGPGDCREGAELRGLGPACRRGACAGLGPSSPLPLLPMAGTRWVLGALLRGCGCSCSSCRRTGAACLPLRPVAAAAAAAAVSGRRRLLLLLGASAAAQSRGLQVAAAAGSLRRPPGPGFALRGPLLPPALAGARGYSSEVPPPPLRSPPPAPAPLSPGGSGPRLARLWAWPLVPAWGR